MCAMGYDINCDCNKQGWEEVEGGGGGGGA